MDGGKLRDLNAEESWALLEDLALYDNESWNDPRDFAKSVKAIALPQDVPMNKISTSCEICSGPHDTQYCMEDPKQAFVEYASSRTDEAGGHRNRIADMLPSDTVKNPKLGTHQVLSARSYPSEDPQSSTHVYSLINAITIHPKQHEESQVNEPDVQKLNSMLESLGLVPQSSNTKFVCTKEEYGEVMFIEIIRDDDDEPQNESPNEGEGTTTEGPVEECFDTFLTRDELTYHKKLDPRENANGGISNFTGRIKGMHVFIGNFTYVVDFMIVEDISLIIDPRLSWVVLGRPFIEISNMTHDLPEGVVRFANGDDEVAYKMPHKIEQYISLSNLEKEHTKSVYLRNEADKRRGVDYVMSKILGFYKECLELGPGYVTGLDDEGEVTLYLMRRSLEVLRKFHWMILGGRFNQLSHVSSPLLSKPREY
ncbi:hypothetical protein Tco_0926376 [Tanacetum coccineum]|uniref:MAK10-like protein n=1 Tax=Tanacetum coccineum TaxID=301880 RepID=A0ABQ5DC58_9ASTR